MTVTSATFANSLTKIEFNASMEYEFLGRTSSLNLLLLWLKQKRLSALQFVNEYLDLTQMTRIIICIELF